MSSTAGNYPQLGWGGGGVLDGQRAVREKTAGGAATSEVKKHFLRA